VLERRSFRFKSALFPLFLVAVLFLARDVWLSALGAELVKQGYVPHVLVSGPSGLYGSNEADVAIQFAIRQGYPAEWFIPLRHTALSTREEAGVVLDALKQRNIHSFLLVTSNFHTARARRIFLHAERQRGGGPDMRVVASDDHFFTAANWWRHREGRKIAFLEWTKTLTSAFGI
jgi:hypothetical protein